MSNSPLVDYTRISPNKSVRTRKIDKITVHYMAGNLTVETCGSVFAPSSRQASSNYGVDSQGRVGMYVPEDYRAWTSSSAANDQRAVTIEVANVDTYGTFTPAAWDKLVELVVDVCKRNGIPELVFTGDSSGTLTWHCMFASTSCPGNYFKDNTRRFIAEVNAKLKGEDDMSQADVQAINGRLDAMNGNLATMNANLVSLLNKLAPQAPVAPFGGRVYRLVNTTTGAHTWTNSPDRRDALVKQGWRLEGEAFTLGTTGDPLWSLVHPDNGEVIMTTSYAEAKALANAGWQSEGVVGTTGDGAEVHRLYNKGNGYHLYTPDANEISALKSAGWTDEGVAFRAV